MVDRPRLDSMLDRLRGYLQRLRELSLTPREAFLRDRTIIDAVKYNFVVGIECCIDIANHVIASGRMGIPETNADSFRVLVDNGVCPPEMLGSLRDMAKFRNLLVHLYWKVEDELVYQTLTTSLNDIEGFAAAVAAYASRA